MDVFVGRDKQVEEAIDALSSIIDEGAVWDIVGVHGIGKTVFIEQVRAEAAHAAHRPEIFAVDMTQRGLDDSYRGDFGPGASAAVLWLTFERSRELMLESVDYFVGKDPKCADFDDFKNRCEDLRKRGDELIAGHDFRSEGSKTDQSSVADQALRTRIRDLQERLDDAFLEAWDEFTTNRRVLITLDPFERLAHNELGHWLVGLLLRLPKTLTLLARVPSSIVLARDQPRMRQLYLSYFTVDQVDAYLATLFGESAKPGIAQAIHGYTDGHPGGTALVAKLIDETGGNIEARKLRRLLNRLPDDREQGWSTLVHFIVDAVHDPVLRKAVDAASIALSFDEPLLTSLLGLDGDERAGATRALNEHRLTQPVRSGVRPNRYRLMEFIRRSLADDVRINRQKQWKRLHERAAEYYFDKLQQEEELHPGGTYGEWYRYERAEWQANKQDWLYHSGQLPERRELTRARFVLVFLEAFWWWGCYEKFDFNQRLLEDWDRITGIWSSSRDILKEDQQLGEALWLLLENYPLGHKKTPIAPWDDMRNKLLVVQRLCGLADGSALPRKPEERKQLARARAMIRVFLAHTRRFKDPADEMADRYYDQALRTFARLDDQWVVSWLRFETADLALERGQDQEAITLLAQAAAITLDELGPAATDDDDGHRPSDLDLDLDFEDAVSGDWDYELLANLHRARADAHWNCGEVDQAAVEYGRAVTDAFWFQGKPHSPDQYTRRFYVEITERTAERLLALAATDADRALRFADAVRAQIPALEPAADLRPAVLTDQVSELSDALFPRGPHPKELRDDDTPFMHHWELLWENRPDTPDQLRELIGEVGAT